MLNTVCDIESPTGTQSGTGAITRGWSKSVVGAKTRYHRNKDQNVLIGTYQVTLEDYKFYFLPSVVISKSDRILIGSDSYEILGVIEDSSGKTKTVYARIKSFK